MLTQEVQKCGLYTVEYSGVVCVNRTGSRAKRVRALRCVVQHMRDDVHDNMRIDKHICVCEVRWLSNLNRFDDDIGDKVNALSVIYDPKY